MQKKTLWNMKNQTLSAAIMHTEAMLAATLEKRVHELEANVEKV